MDFTMQYFPSNSFYPQDKNNQNLNTKQRFEEDNIFNQNFNSELQQRNNEVTSQYRNRKIVYENVLNDLKDHEKAVCYSNIWSNMIYLGVRYPKKLEELVMKYCPQP